MEIDDRQYRELHYLFDTLLDRVRYLRDEEGKTAPCEAEMSELFTDLDDYPDADSDEEVNYFIAMLNGFAIGLGLVSTLDLYEAYRDNIIFQTPKDEIPLRRLVDAAERALVILGGLSGGHVRDVVNELGQALAHFRGKEWS